MHQDHKNIGMNITLNDPTMQKRMLRLEQNEGRMAMVAEVVLDCLVGS